MKVSVNDEVIFELTENQKKVIKNDIHADEFDADMKRRLEYILKHKYERCLERLKKEWCSDDGTGSCKLKKNGVSNIPVDDEALAELIFEQPNYKDKKERKIEKGSPIDYAL